MHFPFAFRDFRLFWVARLATTLAQSSIVIAVGWQTYDIARETMGIREAALQLGLIGLFQFAPLFFLTPLTGWAADRFDRRHIARLSLLIQLTCALLLVYLGVTGSTSLHALFAVAALLGAARAFYQPSMNALAPNLVPREVLPRAIATSAIAGRMGAILGPVAGGYAYAVAPFAAYAMSATLLLVSLVCISFVRPRERIDIRGTRHPIHQMAEGFRYVIHNRLLLGAISLDLFAVLLGGATALLPIFARDVLAVGPSGLGHLRAAPAVGAMITAVWMSHRPLQHHVGLKMLGAVAVYGVATVGFGLSRWLPLSLFCLFILGASDMVSVCVRQSLMQMSTPDEMRGRVGAISTLFISASNELGEAESGFLAALIGPIAAVVAGGAGAVAIAFAWAKLFPQLVATNDFVDAVPSATAETNRGKASD